MKELLDKLSSYNIFNYLFPGAIFVVILGKISNYDLVQKDIVIGVFLYYFIGLIISRVGSLIIWPFLRWIKLIKFRDYNTFINASKQDSKIELFSEINNMYRTLCSLFFLLVTIKFYDLFLKQLSFFKNYGEIVLILLLLLLLLFSYRKQTIFITQRIDKIKETDE